MGTTTFSVTLLVLRTVQEIRVTSVVSVWGVSMMHTLGITVMKTVQATAMMESVPKGLEHA